MVRLTERHLVSRLKGKFINGSWRYFRKDPCGEEVLLTRTQAFYWHAAITFALKEMAR